MRHHPPNSWRNSARHFLGQGRRDWRVPIDPVAAGVEIARYVLLGWIEVPAKEVPSTEIEDEPRCGLHGGYGGGRYELRRLAGGFGSKEGSTAALWVTYTPDGTVRSMAKDCCWLPWHVKLDMTLHRQPK